MSAFHGWPRTASTPPCHPLSMHKLMLIAVLALASCELPPPPGATDRARSMADDAKSRLEASEGGQLLLRSIDAHGGLDAWYGAPTSSYTWDYSNVGSNIRFKTRLVADNYSRRIYHDLLELGTPENPMPASGRFAWDGEDAWISPDSLQGINPRFWATTGYYFESIPFILADPGLHYTVLPDDTLNGMPHDMVRVSYENGVGDSPGDTYTLFLNKETAMVDGIRYTVTFGGGPPAAGEPLRETLFYYKNYTTVDGLTVATRFRGFNVVDGVLSGFKNEAWAGDISFSNPFDERRLAMPEDGRVQPMPNAQP